MAKKIKKMYKHGGRTEYAKLHGLSQKEYGKAVRGKKAAAYKHGGRFRPQHD
jgi:hypothetical protein